MRTRTTAGVVLAATAVAGPAVFSTGAVSASGGGAQYVPRPVIDKVSCIRRCASRRRARAGSTLKITGRDLQQVTRVIFLGSSGRGDDVTVRTRSGSSRRVQVRVPIGAVSGPVTLRSSRNLRSNRSRPVAILPPPPPSPNPTLSPAPGPRAEGAPRLETGTSRTKVFYGARRAVVFSYRLNGRAAQAVEVQLVRASDGATVKSWKQGSVPEGQVRTVTWSGALGNSAAPQGRYSFRVTAEGADGAVARSSAAQDLDRDAFDLYGNVFPIRGRHSYGGAGAGFGAGRVGHTHHGQDVMAACGTRLVAARGGKVIYSGYQSAAGYYIVIDGAGTSFDYVYMHMTQRSPFRTGDRVYTGQQFGVVGESGNAQGCHLHFELWRGGWYRGGGAPVDPLPALRSWDGWS